jgi:hypothetical protein
MSPNRIVAFLTPLVFAPAAGAIAAWLARHFPGVKVDPDDLEKIFIAGALIALAPAAQWLHGWQKYETQQAETERAVELANIAAAPAAASLPVAFAADDAQVEEPDDQPAGGQDDFDPFLDLDDGDEELLADEQPATTGS